MQGWIETAAPRAVLFATLAVTLAVGAANAADDCVTAPSGDAPQGSHWYYRTNRATNTKCWYLGQNGAVRPAHAARNAVETVGHAAPATQAGAAPAPSSEAANRDCAIAQSVLNYRKILATVFHSDATSTDVDAQAKELAAKGCRNP